VVRRQQAAGGLEKGARGSGSASLFFIIGLEVIITIL
jgi:hypothetical protein